MAFTVRGILRAAAIGPAARADVAGAADMSYRGMITHVKTSGMAIMIISAATARAKTPPVDFVVIGSVLFVVTCVMARVVSVRIPDDRPVGMTMFLGGAAGFLAILGLGGAVSMWILVPAGVLVVSAYLVWPIHGRRRRAAGYAIGRDKGGPA